MFSKLFRNLMMVIALTLGAAACGSDAAPVDTGTTDGDTEELTPLADGESDSPAVAGACLVGEPDCVDTIVGEPTDLPPGDDEPAGEPTEPLVGAPVNGGLTISEALATDAEGILAVKGHIFDDGSGLRLCEALASTGERFACEGAAVALAGVDLDTVDELVFLEGTTYTDDEVSLFGVLANGVFDVDAGING